jgi:methanogenic corrinoid protein MtbC1
VPPFTEPPLWRSFLDRLLGHRRDDALSFAAELARQCEPAKMIVEVMAPAQAELGALWEQCAITVDQEHRATAVTDAVLARLGPAPPGPDAKTVVSACVPGEWHVLPARMANTVLELSGWRVRFTGANTTPDRLRRQVRAHRPTAVALSCAIASRLPEANDLVAVAHAEGVPVIAGGRAFNESRARRLGADAWIADPRQAPGVVCKWIEGKAALASSGPPPDPGFAALVIDRERVVGGVVTRVRHALGGLDGALERQLEVGVRVLYEHLASALYLEDDTIFLDAVDWAADVGDRRGFPRWTTIAGLGALEAELDAEMGSTRGLVEAAVARLEP